MEEEFPTHVLQKRTLTIGVASRLRDGPLGFGLCVLTNWPSLMAAYTQSQEKSSRKVTYGRELQYFTNRNHNEQTFVYLTQAKLH
jgi:hypothetical protein